MDNHTRTSDLKAARQQEVPLQNWHLARQVVKAYGDFIHGRDSREDLEALGFTVMDYHDDLYFKVIPPPGWTYTFDGNWAIIKDETGTKRISMFYKGAINGRITYLIIE